MSEAILQGLRSLPGDLVVIIMSVLPVSEVRGGIPAGLLLDVPLWRTFVLAVVFATLAVVPILLWLEPLIRMLSRAPLLARLLNWVLEHARRKNHIIDKYGIYGLTFIVSLPIPGAGSYTGAILASLRGMPLRQSLGCVVVGLIIQSAVVTAACMGLLQFPFAEKLTIEGFLLLGR